MSSHDAEQMTQRDALGHLVVLDDLELDLRPYHLLSHEFRTPLTVLLAGAELLAERIQGEDLQELAEAMGRAARKIDRLIDGMAGAFEAPGTRRFGRLGSAIAGVRDELSAEQRRRLLVTIPESAMCLHVPVVEVREVLHELVGNACRFSPSPLPIVLHAEADDDRLALVVEDEGPGIQPDDRMRAFAPFQQLDMRTAREHDGLGLGLYRARQTARRLGGDVTIEDPCRGARVRLVLPVSGTGPSRSPARAGDDRR